MTATVVTKKDRGERMTMEFILPSKYKAAKEAPRPVDERVVMREESSHHSCRIKASSSIPVSSLFT